MARILYICGGRNFRHDSLGPKISGVVQTWQTAGHEVVHICGGDIERPEGGSSGYGAQSHHSAWFRKSRLLAPLVRTVSEWRDFCHDKQMLHLLKRTVQDWRPDIIWERSCRLHLAGLKLSRQIGVPYVLEWKDHIVPYNISLFRLPAGFIESRKNNQSDFLVVESGVLRDKLASDGVNKNKIIVAFNAAEPNKFTPKLDVRQSIRSKLNIDQDEVMIGYLGSYAFYHDAIRLILASERIKQLGNNKVKIVMIGNGKHHQECYESAQRLGLLNGMLDMRPGVPPNEVPGLLSALDVAVLPGSTDIICPIKVQEYMAAGLPVIVPDYPCNREVVTENETGLFFTPFDETSLADSICRLAGDRNLRDRLGRRAREEVEERFTWEKTWGQPSKT